MHHVSEQQNLPKPFERVLNAKIFKCMIYLGSLHIIFVWSDRTEMIMHSEISKDV